MNKLCKSVYHGLVMLVSKCHTKANQIYTYHFLFLSIWWAEQYLRIIQHTVHNFIFLQANIKLREFWHILWWENQNYDTFFPFFCFWSPHQFLYTKMYHFPANTNISWDRASQIYHFKDMTVSQLVNKKMVPLFVTCNGLLEMMEHPINP